ncbi:hypothetical protein [Vibrio cyclitrophicus]|uniref:hypothetical protein n=1 Tax=Vibrio cyclitrophicus TaxID=47951 RepID=UPI00029B18E6|nr:hypothetical protein [Vibrio cyclitrophicus]OEE21752.1 hypothetical protein OAM_21155 [Vibrio cyclitrophicus ZF14]
MKRQSTLEKLGSNYHTSVQTDELTKRKFVTIETDSGLVHIIDNSNTVKDTLLITDGNEVHRVENNAQAYHSIAQAIESLREGVSND